MFPNGRAGGFLALAEALAMLEAGEAGPMIVGGVDSYLDLYLLGTLDAEGRILGNGVMDGFIPGEGAAFLLLGPVRESEHGAASALARIAAAAFGAEKGHRYGEEPYRGEGLAETFARLFSADGAGDERVATVLAGLNGENFGAKEWGTASLRSRPHFVDDIHLEHPVDCFGDVGAALGSLLVSLGAVGIRNGYLRAPCLAWCSSDREERGAALLVNA
jgi:3-oxoacyl-[acyl-carrier-protein] synthase-1